MYRNQLPIFKELNPYCGQIDGNNRWIRLSELVPWDEMERLYLEYFDERKRGTLKKSRTILGLFLGQMLLKNSDRDILDFFHENPYFQYFCGFDSFVVKLKKSVIHHSLLSKRRKRLGKAYMQRFELEVLAVLKERGLVTGNSLMLDATVFPAKITYPNDIKLLNTIREWSCQKILDIKNVIDPKRRVRTYRKIARKLYLNFQKTKRKKKTFLRKNRNKMLRFVRRNIEQLEYMLNELEKTAQSLNGSFSDAVLTKIRRELLIAKEIYCQQLEMAKKRGRRVANRIVSFHQPQIRPIIRGKEGKGVEFGPKANIALVDGYAFLDDFAFNAFHEGNCLPASIEKHEARFGSTPDLVIADQLYATRANRLLLQKLKIDHSFKPIGRPPNDPDSAYKKDKRLRRSRQNSRNQIEGFFGHVKQHLNLEKIHWRVPDGPEMQIRLGLSANNLISALA